jgi:hypothetical protein
MMTAERPKTSGRLEPHTCPHQLQRGRPCEKVETYHNPTALRELRILARDAGLPELVLARWKCGRCREFNTIIL